jgi:hypothetical protein
MLFALTSFVRRFRGELLISAFSVVVGAGVSILIDIFVKTGDPYLLGFYTFGFVVVFLMLALLFNQKRLIENKFKTVNQVLIDYFGYSSKDNQFYSRREHYAREKVRLANALVRRVLPRVVKRIYADYPNLAELSIIIDSGTTLTPVFPELVVHGVPRKEGVEVNIYTNSMSGIEEIHKLDNSDNFAISDDHIALIGGQPLRKYRATTGRITEDFLEFLWKNRDPNRQRVTLSILTANWLIAGSGLDSLSLCARGRGHIQFKRVVGGFTEYRIVVAPLGKILRLRDVGILNRMLESKDGGEYQDYRLEEGKKDKTYLLTTRRRDNSLSPLCPVTLMLDTIRSDNSAKNYVLCEECPPFDPPGTTEREVLFYESPHRYVRDKFQEAYLIPSPLARRG